MALASLALGEVLRLRGRMIAILSAHHQNRSRCFTLSKTNSSIKSSLNEADALANKIAEANDYLRSTDWVEPYILRHELNLEIIPESSSKWTVNTKRNFYKRFLAENS